MVYYNYKKQGSDYMKINKFLFLAGAITALGAVYVVCKKHKMRLVSEVEGTMVKGCCDNSATSNSATSYDFEETAEFDIGNTELKASMSISNDNDANNSCECDE
jgi:hypothetical protein